MNGIVIKETMPLRLRHLCGATQSIQGTLFESVTDEQLNELTCLESDCTMRLVDCDREYVQNFLRASQVATANSLVTQNWILESHYNCVRLVA